MEILAKMLTARRSRERSQMSVPGGKADVSGALGIDLRLVLRNPPTSGSTWFLCPALKIGLIHNGALQASSRAQSILLGQ